MDAFVTPDPELAATAPSDRTTLTEVIDAYRDSGFAGDFTAEPRDPESAGPVAAGGAVSTAVVRCGRCATSSDPGGLQIHSIRRLEGASDPADMMAIVATTCPVCGSEGTLVLGFGPMSSAVDADVLGAMQDVRGDGVLPPAIAPGERGTTDRP